MAGDDDHQQQTEIDILTKWTERNDGMDEACVACVSEMGNCVKGLWRSYGRRKVLNVSICDWYDHVLMSYDRHSHF
jgi:hypothetical protein